jgi:hypothetical protein
LYFSEPQLNAISAEDFSLAFATAPRSIGTDAVPGPCR